jgi:tRNA pseudouridine55 synthase
LRRTGVGALTLEHAVTLDALSDAAQGDAARGDPAQGELDRWLQPVDTLLSTFPAVHLDDEAARRFLHGQRLRLADLSVGDGISSTISSDLSREPSCAPRVRVYAAAEGRLLGVAKAADGVLAPERLIVAAAATS